MRKAFYKNLFIEVREEYKELSLRGKIAVPFFILGGFVALVGFAVMLANFLVTGAVVASFIGVGLFVGGAVLLGLAKPVAGKIAQFVEYIKRIGSEKPVENKNVENKNNDLRKQYFNSIDLDYRINDPHFDSPVANEYYSYLTETEIAEVKSTYGKNGLRL